MKILSRTLKPLLFLFLACFFTSNVKAAISPVDILIKENSEETLSGILMPSELEDTVNEIRFFIVEEETKNVVWKSVVKEKLENIETALSYDFTLDIKNTGLQGKYLLYVNLLDAFNQRLSIGKKDLSLNTKTTEATQPSRVLDVMIERSGDNALAIISFFSFNEGQKLIPSVDIFEHSFNGNKIETHKGESFVSRYGEQQIELNFPWPKKPEIYPLLFSMKTDDGIAIGGEISKTIEQKGKYAEIFGIIPSNGQIIENGNLEIKMEGFVPTDQNYNLEIKIDQKKAEEVIENETKMYPIPKGDGLFTINDVFIIKSKTQWVQLFATIIDPKSNEVIEEKEYRWINKSAPENLLNENGEINGSVVQNNSKNIIFAGIGLFILLIILFFIMRKNKKRLSLWLLFLSSSLVSLGVQAQVNLNSYNIFLDVPSTILLTTSGDTDYSKGGFNTLVFSGTASGIVDNDLFIDMEKDGKPFEKAVVTFSQAGEDDIVVNIDSENERQDLSFVFLETNETEYLPGKIIFHIYANITGLNLKDGPSTVKTELVFQGGETKVLPDIEITINSSPPVLDYNSFFIDELTPTKEDKDLRIQYDGGAKELSFKGNFCDDSKDQVCLEEAGNDLYKTYEVCNLVGSCTFNSFIQNPRYSLFSAGQTFNYSQNDLFFYDPFPPLLKFANIFRIKTKDADGARLTLEEEAVIDESLANIRDLDSQTAAGILDGNSSDLLLNTNPTVSSHGRFVLDPEDVDNELTTNPKNQGPGGDPNACGAEDINGFERPGAPFFFGPSINDSVKTVCTESFIPCSNAAGGFGWWNRKKSLETGEIFKAEACKDLGQLPWKPIRGECGTVHGSKIPGVGGLTKNQLCDKGIPTEISGGGPWSWTCEGLNNGGDSTTCRAGIKTGGPGGNSCGAATTSPSYYKPVNGLCSVGIPKNEVKNLDDNLWEWECGNSNTADANDVSCSTLIATTNVEEALCGASTSCYPTQQDFENDLSNRCQEGTASVPDADGNIRTWNCSTDSDVKTCTATIDPNCVDGACGPANFGSVYTLPFQESGVCSVGWLLNPPRIQGADGEIKTWQCKSTTSTSPVCNAVPYITPEVGECNDTLKNNTYLNKAAVLAAIPCDAGKAVTDSDITLNPLTQEWNWVCQGIEADDSGVCTAKSNNTSPIPGLCGTINKTTLATKPNSGLCSEGGASIVHWNENIKVWEWSCSGVNGGKTDYCYVNKGSNQTDGECNTQTTALEFINTPESDLCFVGSPSPVPVNLNGTNWEWTCSGILGGSPSSTCSAVKSNTGTGTDAACLTPPNEAFFNSSDSITPAPGCSVGTTTGLETANPGPWFWTCNSTNGGNPSHCRANNNNDAICSTNPTLNNRSSFCAKGSVFDDNNNPDDDILITPLPTGGRTLSWICESPQAPGINKNCSYTDESPVCSCPIGSIPVLDGDGNCSCINETTCNPAQKQVILEFHGETNIWINEIATDLNQNWTEDTVDRIGKGECLYGCETTPKGDSTIAPPTSAPAACSFGCRYGKEPSTKKCARCFSDKFPYCLPLCFDGSAVDPGPDGTLGTSDDFCS